MSKKRGGMITLHCNMSITIPLKQDRISKIDSKSPSTSLKIDRRVVNALAA
jgi:hypothetical protein